jgi:hypothetical protein
VRHAVILFAASAAAAQPNVEGLAQFGTAFSETEPYAAPDGAGGVYAGGNTYGSLFGPNAGAADAFLLRCDGEGDALWGLQFGTGGYDFIHAVTAHPGGGVVVAGNVQGVLGEEYFGSSDAFVARYNDAGGLIWVVQFGTPDSDDALALLADTDGIFVAGNTYGSLGAPNAGWHDIFLLRFDGDGNQLWARQFGSDRGDTPLAMASDGAGGFFMAGWTEGDLGGPLDGQSDAFLARGGTDGMLMWIEQLGTPATDNATALVADGAGGVFVAGYTSGGLGGEHLGYLDVFLARYGGDASAEWMTQLGTSRSELAFSLAPDGFGGVMVGGATGGDWGGPNAGGGDAFVARIDGGGTFRWVTQFGTPEPETAYALASAGPGAALVVGPTDGDLAGPSHGAQDIFLAKLRDVCYPDFTGDGTLDLFDFLGYVNAFNAGDDLADCDANGGLDLFDFLCFVNSFNEGC